MDLHLRGMRALVTGSTAGIGEAIARSLAAEGASIILHGRNETAARRIAAEIERDAPVSIVLGDLNNSSEVQAVGEQAVAAFGGVDILVNNALDSGAKPWLEVTPEDWARLYNVTVISAAKLVHAVAPGMKARKWGRLIQVGSVAGTMAYAASPHYGAAKAALLNFSASLSKELGPFAITANTISPGPIATETLQRGIAAYLTSKGQGDLSEPELFDYLSRQPHGGMMWNPLHRLGHVREVADFVAFVASPRAGFINGANLRIDGGGVPSINP